MPDACLCTRPYACPIRMSMCIIPARLGGPPSSNAGGRPNAAYVQDYRHRRRHVYCICIGDAGNSKRASGRELRNGTAVHTRPHACTHVYAHVYAHHTCPARRPPPHQTTAAGRTPRAGRRGSRLECSGRGGMPRPRRARRRCSHRRRHRPRRSARPRGLRGERARAIGAAHAPRLRQVASQACVRPMLDVGYTSASPAARLLRGYGRAGAHNDRLGESLPKGCGACTFPCPQACVDTVRARTIAAAHAPRLRKADSHACVHAQAPACASTCAPNGQSV